MKIHEYIHGNDDQHPLMRINTKNKPHYEGKPIRIVKVKTTDTTNGGCFKAWCNTARNLKEFVVTYEVEMGTKDEYGLPVCERYSITSVYCAHCLIEILGNFQVIA